MKAKATVAQIIDENIAIVSVERRAACDGCHKAADGKGCSVCTLLGSKGEARARAKNTVGAAIGDTVEVESRTKRIMGYAALVFLLPVALAIVAYLIGTKLSLGEGASLLLALAGLLLSFLLIFFYSKLVVSRRVDIEIVAITQKAEQHE